MAIEVENLVHPLTTLIWSSILPKNSRFANSKSLNDDIPLLNNITKTILIQRGWKIVDHVLNWDLENGFYIPENEVPKFCFKFFHVIQNTKEHLLNHILSQGNIKTWSYFRCNFNHDDDEGVKLNSNSNKQSDDFNKFRVGFINTQGGIFTKIDDLCDYMTVNQLHLLGISETNLKSNQTISKHNFIWIDKPTKETVGGLGILHNENLIIKENKDSLLGFEGRITVDIKTGKVWTTFIFIYLWQNGKTSFNAKNANNEIYQELSLFINKCKSINQNIVVMGDVNGRLKGSIGDDVVNQ